MAEIVKYKSRSCQKIDTAGNWALATNFVPLKGEIIIYSDLNLMKVGDGSTTVNDLPFVDVATKTQVQIITWGADD
jgi:hypothetical protein